MRETSQSLQLLYETQWRPVAGLIGAFVPLSNREVTKRLAANRNLSVFELDTPLKERIRKSQIKKHGRQFREKIADDTPINHSIEMQGTLFKVKTKMAKRARRYPQEYRRGKVDGFSKRSRKRLIENLARLDPDKNKVVFITLTYPEKYPSPRHAKKHLRAFLERLRRKFPNAGGVWRLEFQKRGAPHFHLLLWNMPYYPHKELQKAWGEIISYENVVTDIRLAQEHKQVMFYVSKYVAKSDDGASSKFNYVPYPHAPTPDDSTTGRLWGYFQKDKMPWGAISEVDLLDCTYLFCKLKEQVFDFGFMNRDLKGFTLFVMEFDSLSDFLTSCATFTQTNQAENYASYELVRLLQW